MTAGFQTDRKRQTIRIEGVCYTAEDIRREAWHASAGEACFRKELFAFLAEWFDGEETLMVHTSGSTGHPKELRVEKRRMMASACLTCSYLGLREGDAALLCMPLKYIAGKMVVVRALVAGLNLLPVTPSGHPLAGLDEIPVFAAMIPMQVYNSLQVEAERERLRQVRHLIIGGGAIDERLAGELERLPHAVWSTYGMTETLSHIALRRVNGEEASDWYTPLDGVEVWLSGEGTLALRAPRVCDGELVTNDRAEIDGRGRFRILGRRDNTINSGGVKIQMEEVERVLAGHVTLPFLITAMPDEKFGEVVVMLVEGAVPEGMDALFERVLPPYWRPKQVWAVERIPLTETGKPDRATARVLARQKAV